MRKTPIGCSTPVPNKNAYSKPSFIVSAKIAVKYLSTNGFDKSLIALGITKYAVIFPNSIFNDSNATFNSPLTASVNFPQAYVPVLDADNHFFTSAGAKDTNDNKSLAFFTSTKVLSMIVVGIKSICFPSIACLTFVFKAS